MNSNHAGLLAAYGYVSEFQPFKAVNLVRRTATGTAAFPPERWDAATARVLAELTNRRNLNPRRRTRTYPRVVKRPRHNSPSTA